MKWGVFFLLIVQRFVELCWAKRNERWMKERGAKEFGQNHYKYIVCMHILFFVSLLLEGRKKRESTLWSFLFNIFIILQLFRFWIIASLGRCWNTKIIVLPNTERIQKGPYRWFRHPNYLVVVLEFIIIPLMFQAYWTAVIFTVWNAYLLLIRIRVEEQALRLLKSPHK
ncbi:isoprenylcysteine carboxyl methyltransferase family protein [Anoxybacillus sp. TBDG-1]